MNGIFSQSASGEEFRRGGDGGEAVGGAAVLCPGAFLCVQESCFAPCRDGITSVRQNLWRKASSCTEWLIVKYFVVNKKEVTHSR